MKNLKEFEDMPAEKQEEYADAMLKIYEKFEPINPLSKDGDK